MSMTIQTTVKGSSINLSSPDGWEMTIKDGGPRDHDHQKNGSISVKEKAPGQLATGHVPGSDEVHTFKKLPQSSTAHDLVTKIDPYPR